MKSSGYCQPPDHLPLDTCNCRGWTHASPHRHPRPQRSPSLPSSICCARCRSHFDFVWVLRPRTFLSPQSLLTYMCLDTNTRPSKITRAILPGALGVQVLPAGRNHVFVLFPVVAPSSVVPPHKSTTTATARLFDDMSAHLHTHRVCQILAAIGVKMTESESSASYRSKLIPHENSLENYEDDVAKLLKWIKTQQCVGTLGSTFARVGNIARHGPDMFKIGTVPKIIKAFLKATACFRQRAPRKKACRERNPKYHSLTLVRWTVPELPAPKPSQRRADLSFTKK